ncbi:hypothetical protein AVEN_134486-1 [Araneus ventricosus]|uniref:Uncharacterized protein n=1 Tax=Araneus ventricosus TaxID=182803 RepID=A0A4Y2RKG6_ARAVE|nr:hypothetical protein AVEN_134486-1 [Araneus ventricosus]
MLQYTAGRSAAELHHRQNVRQHATTGVQRTAGAMAVAPAKRRRQRQNHNQRYAGGVCCEEETQHIAAVAERQRYKGAEARAMAASET